MSIAKIRRLAASETVEDFLVENDDTIVLDIDMGAIIGAKCQPHIEVAHTLGIDGDPISAAGQDRPFQSFAFEIAARNVGDDPVAVRAVTDWYRFLQVGIHRHQRFQVQAILPGYH